MEVGKTPYLQDTKTLSFFESNPTEGMAEKIERLREFTDVHEVQERVEAVCSTNTQAFHTFNFTCDLCSPFAQIRDLNVRQKNLKNEVWRWWMLTELVTTH